MSRLSTGNRREFLGQLGTLATLGAISPVGSAPLGLPAASRPTPYDASLPFPPVAPDGDPRQRLLTFWASAWEVACHPQREVARATVCDRAYPERWQNFVKDLHTPRKRYYECDPYHPHVGADAIAGEVSPPLSSWHELTDPWRYGDLMVGAFSYEFPPTLTGPRGVLLLPWSVLGMVVLDEDEIPARDWLGHEVHWPDACLYHPAYSEPWCFSTINPQRLHTRLRLRPIGRAQLHVTQVPPA